MGQFLSEYFFEKMRKNGYFQFEYHIICREVLWPIILSGLQSASKIVVWDIDLVPFNRLLDSIKVCFFNYKRKSGCFQLKYEHHSRKFSPNSLSDLQSIYNWETRISIRFTLIDSLTQKNFYIRKLKRTNGTSS